jgi:predicted ATP-dependent endonuclease of OLD family
MYLERIHLENVKCFNNLKLDFMKGRGKPRLMTIILGDNGMGKSTLLKSIAISLGGETIKKYFSGSSENWVRIGYDIGKIYAEIRAGKSDPKRAGKTKFKVEFLLTGEKPKTLDNKFVDKYSISASLYETEDLSILNRTAYSKSETGWFTCGYGPFRRIKPSGRVKSKSFDYLDRKEERFASLYNQDEKIISLEDWLIELDRQAMIEERENKKSKERKLYNIIGNCSGTKIAH